MSEKLNVCVIFGGQSSEHEVSRVSVVSVINNLDKEKYNLLLLGITKQGGWYLYHGDIDKIPTGEWEQDTDNLSPAVISPSSVHSGLLVFNENSVNSINVDIAFPVLHGIYGEDGTIQGLFELAGIKYVGCGVLASCVGMNKIYAKIAFASAGLKQAKWVAVYKKEFGDMDGVVKRVEALGYPCFVKPANAGSSVGISRATDRATLIEALNTAVQHDRQIVVEEAVLGREVECSVLGNDKPRASVVGEVISADGFYDYDEKYKNNTAQICIPADLDNAATEKIRASALIAFKAIDGAGLSRVDFFVRHSDGAIIINEINTLPGFTSISMYTKLWKEAGVSYNELLDELIRLAAIREK